MKTGKRTFSFVCIALTLAQVLAFVHEGVVAHAVCAEHGEAIHADRAVRTATTAPVRDSSCAVAEDAVDSAAHAHEHCACMAQRRERFALQLIAALLSDTAAPAVPAVFASEPSFAAGIAPVLVAPKNSPPV